MRLLFVQNVLVSCVILFDRVLLSRRLQKASQMQQSDILLIDFIFYRVGILLHIASKVVRGARCGGGATMPEPTLCG